MLAIEPARDLLAATMPSNSPCCSVLLPAGTRDRGAMWILLFLLRSRLTSWKLAGLRQR